MVVKFGLFGNLKLLKLEQLRKASLPIDVTLSGSVIDVNAVLVKAPLPIDVTLFGIVTDAKLLLAKKI